jgi:hypothetical protein
VAAGRRPRAHSAVASSIWSQANSTTTKVPPTRSRSTILSKAPEVFDVVQGQACHGVVERLGIGELLDPHVPEDGAFGRPRIDGRHGVAGTREGLGQLPLPATDF